MSCSGIENGPPMTRLLGGYLNNVETYLNKVVKEFETSLRNLSQDDTVPLSTLPFTYEFICPGCKSSNGRQKAIRGFHKSIDLLTKITA